MVSPKFYPPVPFRSQGAGAGPLQVAITDLPTNTPANVTVTRVSLGSTLTYLTQVCGISLLPFISGTLAVILGRGQRFVTEAQFAFCAGVASLEASSAARTRRRLNRGGNRCLSAVLYRIALAQAGYAPGAQAYLDRRRSEGKTGQEAMRALKRYLVCAIWRLGKECRHTSEAQAIKQTT